MVIAKIDNFDFDAKPIPIVIAKIDNIDLDAKPVAIARAKLILFTTKLLSFSKGDEKGLTRLFSSSQLPF